MSSDLTAEPGKLLLRARGVEKEFMSPRAPIARLVAALRGRHSFGNIHPILRGIDLDVHRGETLGIMGRNGAGKSTLLGILAGVLPASTGTVERYAKISVLLELGAGFDGNLSGRDNSRVYCSLMGMSRASAEQKLPAIERFADIGEYFDLPSRTYSSGMYARVAFAAAIHVDAELIIVDETLSVGDASFRVKCYQAIERMQQDGKTFLMVSHNQNIIANFCSRALVIEAGRKIFDGSPMDAVNVYKRVRHENEIRASLARSRLAEVELESIANDGEDELNRELVMESMEHSQEEDTDGRQLLIVTTRLRSLRSIPKPVFNLIIRNASGVLIGALETSDFSPGLDPVAEGQALGVKARFLNVLAPGAYFLSVAVWDLEESGRKPLALYDNCLRIDIVKNDRIHGLVDLDFSWQPVSAVEGRVEVLERSQTPMKA